jgi:hypothetical protein
MEAINLDDLVVYLEKNGIEVEVDRNPSKERLSQIEKSIKDKEKMAKLSGALYKLISRNNA